MEPWFEWSWLLGIKPIHRNGWLFAAAFWTIEFPLMFATVGAFNLGPVVQIAAAAGFVLVGLAGFAFMFSKFKE